MKNIHRFLLAYSLSSIISINIWATVYIGSHFLPYTMEQYPNSGEVISENMARYAEKWGVNVPRRPQAGGVTLTPISKHEGHISDMTEPELGYSHCIR